MPVLESETKSSLLNGILQDSRVVLRDTLKSMFVEGEETDGHSNPSIENSKPIDREALAISPGPTKATGRLQDRLYAERAAAADAEIKKSEHEKHVRANDTLKEKLRALYPSGIVSKRVTTKDSAVPTVVDKTSAPDDSVAPISNIVAKPPAAEIPKLESPDDFISVENDNSVQPTKPIAPRPVIIENFDGNKEVEKPAAVPEDAKELDNQETFSVELPAITEPLREQIPDNIVLPEAADVQPVTGNISAEVKPATVPVEEVAAPQISAEPISAETLPRDEVSSNTTEVSRERGGIWGFVGRIGKPRSTSSWAQVERLAEKRSVDDDENLKKAA